MIQQKQMKSATRKPSPPKQMASAQKQMTLSTPQRDTRAMIIPQGTIKEESRRMINLPFAWLRTWFFALLAIITLPIGVMLLLVGQAQENNIDSAWVETIATVNTVGDTGITYRFDVDGTARTGTVRWLSDYEKFFVAQADGTVGVRLNLCDIIAPFVYPNESGAEFTVWADSSGRFVSCFPVDEDTWIILNLLGWALIITSSWILLSNIGRSANSRVKSRRRTIEAV